MYLLLLVVLLHETFVANVGEEKSLVYDDDGGVLVGGGVGGALVGVPLPSHVCLASQSDGGDGGGHGCAKSTLSS